MLASVYANSSYALPRLIESILKYGITVPSRNGESKELGPLQFQLTNPGNGYLNTPGRRASLPAQIAETMWLLAGRDDVEWLSHYLPRAAEFSDDGVTWRGGYGPRIRNFGDDPAGAPGIDQLDHVVDLIKADPTTRRAVISIYDPLIDVFPGKDIPCNNWLHFIGRDGVLNLHVATRSNDLIWGWSGINAFEWNVLLKVVAGLTGQKPGRIIFSISSLHIYEHHYDRAKKILEAANAVPLMAPPAKLAPEFDAAQGGIEIVSDLDDLVEKWFRLEKEIRDYADGPQTDEPHALLTEIWAFPEPMMQGWLFALLTWNTRGGTPLPAYLKNTDLHKALSDSPARKEPVVEVPVPAVAATDLAEGFLKYVQDLHAEKDKAYGDSWCRRGEQMAIMANIARKVDRLGVAGAGDTASDTALDMAVYLVKYSIWHRNQKAGSKDSFPITGPEHVAQVNLILRGMNDRHPDTSFPIDDLTARVSREFDRLEQLVKANTSRGAAILSLAGITWELARRLWVEEQKQQAWKDGNATRPFNGYIDPEGEAA